VGEPIDYLIVRNMQTALGAMSVATGYHYTVAGSSVKLDPNHDVQAFVAPDGPRPFVILELKPEDREYQPARQVRIILPIRIHWVGESFPHKDESRLQTYLRGCADVERAIAADPSRGGLAVDTKVLSRTCDDSTEGAQVWAIIDTEIGFYRTDGQPDATP
jgi:hypothetical protein